MVRRGTRSLRTRLLLIVLALVAAASAAIGTVSVLSLQAFLQGRLDEQLTGTVQRVQEFRDLAPLTAAPEDDHLVEHLAGRRGRSHLDDGPRFLLAPGQQEGTLGVLVHGGMVASAAVLDRTGTPRPLPATTWPMLARVPVTGRATDVDLGGDLGRYRVAAGTLPDGSVFVAGLPLRDVEATVHRLALVAGMVTLAALLLAAAAGLHLLTWALRPLRRVAATAARVTRLPLHRGEVALAERVPDADADPATEVGQVGAALNAMLGHVGAALRARQASETRVRRFVADASHELRTPLASIRGYTDLVTRNGGAALPLEVQHALGRVASEALRMSSLVEDLLLLARLDEGRPVERAPVDVTRLVVDATGDAAAAGPEHHWRLLVPSEPVWIVGDAARVHQVVVNLLANARHHTPAGTVVTAEVSVEVGERGRRALIAVQDDGPGIPEGLVPEVFGRFVRGDGSRSRRAGGTGLGLAIVRAVVTAHDGDVSVTSRPGLTRFEVRLPATTAPECPGDSGVTPESFVPEEDAREEAPATTVALGEPGNDQRPNEEPGNDEPRNGDGRAPDSGHGRHGAGVVTVSAPPRTR